MCAGYGGAGQLTRHCSAPDAPCGRQTQNAFPATLPPASAGQRPQDMGRPGRPCGQHGSPLSCPGAYGLRRRPHAFHTRARRWNRGHFRRRRTVDETSTLNKLASTPTRGLGWYKVHRERHCNGTEGRNDKLTPLRAWFLFLRSGRRSQLTLECGPACK